MERLGVLFVCLGKKKKELLLSFLFVCFLRSREIQSNLSSGGSFPQMPKQPDLSQVNGSPLCMAGNKAIEQSAVFPGHTLTGNWIRAGAWIQTRYSDKECSNLKTANCLVLVERFIKRLIL